MFFFADTQINRQAQGGSVLTSVPTAQDRTGNLGDWLAASPNYQIYDPATGNQTDGTGRTPFPGNVIPTTRLSPQALAIMSLLAAAEHHRHPLRQTTTMPAATSRLPATCGTRAGTTT